MKALSQLLSRRPALLVWLISLAFFGTIIYFLASALLTPDAPSTLEQQQIKMHRVQGQGQRGDQLGWKFIADSSDISTDGMLTTYHHLRQGTYYLKGKPAYQLTADQVTLDMRTQNYTASGAVHVWSVRPRDLSDLRTDNLDWNNPLQTLNCPSTVRVKYKGFDMVTAHLQANLLSGSSSLGSTSIRRNG